MNLDQGHKLVEINLHDNYFKILLNLYQDSLKDSFDVGQRGQLGSAQKISGFLSCLV